MGRRVLKRTIEKDMGYKTPCHIWQLSLNHHGYGQIFNSETAMAHVYYYTQKYGPIPAGLQLDHLCKVRSCVNPDHLQTVTPAENKRRGKGVKLNIEKANEIRELYTKYNQSIEELAIIFDISKPTVREILKGEIWR